MSRMPHRALLWIFCFVGLAMVMPGAWAQEGRLEVAAPEEVGMSADRLTRIDELMREHVEQGRIAGTVVMIARRDRVVYNRAFGWRDREAEAPMTSDTLFRIASMTKPVTAVAALMLWEEGRFLLSDPVARHLPEFRNMEVLIPEGHDDRVEPNAREDGVEYITVPAERPITIGQLLNHTSGFTYGFLGREHLSELYREAGIPDGLAQTEDTLAEVTRKLGTLPLYHQPGEAWEYGVSSDVVGRLVEVVSGLGLAEFFERRIFEPMGMEDTHFFIPPEKRRRMAAVYGFNPRSGELLRLPESPIRLGNLRFSVSYPYEGPRVYFSGGAGLTSSPEDYMRFLRMLHRGGELDGTRLLGPETVELMTRNNVGEFALRQQYGDKYGFGVAVRRERLSLDNVESPGSYSWGGLFYTVFWVDPEEDIIGLFMAQMFPHNHLSLARRLRVLTYQAILD